MIDCSSETVIASIDVGGSPDMLALNTSNNKIYSENNSSRDISIIDCFNNSLITTLPMPSIPTSIEYNSVENEFGVKTLEEIDSLIEEKGEKKEQIDSQIETEYAELKENFEW